jgi:2-dehydropantoate 2-reductase
VTALAERPDLILLTVKTQDVPAACAAIADAAGGVPVVAAQNGVRGDELAAAALGREVVLGAVVMCAATYLRPGAVSVEFPGWLVLGEPFGPITARTRAIAGVLDAAVPTHIARHIERVRWAKLVANLNNGVAAATGLTLPEIARAPDGRRISLQLMREGVRVARAAGVRLDHGLYGLTPRAVRRDPAAAVVALLQSALAPLLTMLPERAALAVIAGAARGPAGRLPVRGSTWQSIARGRPSEVAYLNGEVVRRGHELGIPTPYNSRVVEVVREVERTRTFRGVAALSPLATEPVERPKRRVLGAGAS